MKKWINPGLVGLIIVDVALVLFQVAIPIMINYTTVSVPWWVEKYPWFPLTILVVLTVFYILFSIFRLLYNRALEENDQNDEPKQDEQADEPRRDIPSSPYLVSVPIKDPANFFGRRKEVDHFFASINAPQPQPLQVLGIRRAGKTSFLHYISHPDVVLQKARDPDSTLFIYVNLESGIKTVADFYLKLAEEINRSLPKQKRGIPVPRRGIPTTKAFEKWLRSPLLADYRLIILLDEFEALRQEAAFKSEFFRGLRSLVINHLGRLAWVTSSYIDLFRLTHLKGEKEKTSPFFNTFYFIPIILAGLTLTEADELIQKPAASHGVRFSIEEIQSIKQLAGGLPFFLQAAAEAWFKAKQQGQDDLRQIKADVKQILLVNMGQHFESYWQSFKKQERTLLTRIATQTEADWLPSGDLFVTHLVRYGIITSQEEDYPYRIAGEVFAEWIRNRTQMESGADSESED
ncbi:MAG: hypothetical protein ACPGWR_20760 [Ardenticatenaceae bacterium]